MEINWLAQGYTRSLCQQQELNQNPPRPMLVPLLQAFPLCLQRSVFAFHGRSRENGSAALLPSCSTSRKWELQHSQVGLKTEHLEQQHQVSNLFLRLMKIRYSQRPPFPQLRAASTPWTVQTTSPLPPRSASAGVTERWTLGLAELIYLHLLCFLPMPASPQNICFMFYSSFNWEQC